MHSQSARDVYYRFTLHYKKENLVVESNLGDFFITFAPGTVELSPQRHENPNRQRPKEITEDDISNAYVKARDMSNVYDPNLIVLWRCNDEIRDKANDEWHEHRKLYGMLFICHIMEQIKRR